MPWAFQQIEPCPARGTFDERLFDDERYWTEPKMDGHRAIAQFGRWPTEWDVTPRFTSRRKSVNGGLFVENTARPGLAHLITAPMGIAEALIGTVLDGEVVLAEGKTDSNKVASALAGAPGALRYAVFDCLFLQGRDLRKEPLVTRREAARIALEAWGNPHAYLVPIATTSEGKRRMALQELEHGEGVIFKNQDAAYAQSAWCKLKGEASYDVVVIGYEPGENSFSGMVGAIEFGQYKDGVLHSFGTASGFDMALRRELTANPGAYLGRVMAITANKRFPTGRFRHPRFKLWRPDKQPADCVYRENES